MDPLTIGLLIGQQALNFLGARSGQKAAQQNLNEARASQARAEQYATAPRYDAFGNLSYYDPATGSWKNVLTPTQEEINKLVESGQFKQAGSQARQYAVQGEARGRGVEAGGLYNQAIEEAKQAPDRAGAVGNIARLLALQGGGQSGPVTASALRTGRGAQLPQILARGGSQGPDIGSTLTQAYQAGQSTPDRRGEALNRAGMISQIASALPGVGPGAQGVGTPDRLAAMQGQSNAAIQSAIANGALNVNKAGVANAGQQAKGLGIDLMGIAKALQGSEQQGPVNVGSATRVNLRASKASPRTSNAVTVFGPGPGQWKDFEDLYAARRVAPTGITEPAWNRMLTLSNALEYPREQRNILEQMYLPTDWSKLGVF